jgi:hypothetical protein
MVGLLSSASGLVAHHPGRLNVAGSHYRIALNRELAIGTMMMALGTLPVASAYGQTRDWRYWPFTATSPWNMPIGSGATYAPITAPYWQNVAAGINVTNATVSVILSPKSDPVWDLYDNTLVTFYNDPPYNNSIWYYKHTPPQVPLQGFQQSTFCNPITQSDAISFLSTSVFPDPNNINSFPFLTNPWSVVTQTVNSVTTNYKPTFHMPAGSCGSPDSDGLMSVIEEDTNLGVDFYAPIVVPNPPPGYSTQMVIGHAIGSYYDLKNGDGTGVWNGRRATLIPTLAGVIRYGEPFSSSTPVIPHALAVVMAQSVMNNAAVWPAAGYDTNNQYGNCGAACLPMGALLAIPSTVDLSTLGITTPEGMAIAQAAQKYASIS